VTRYAEGTEVPADRSRAEIEKILTRYGAESFMYGWDREFAVLGFRFGVKMVRFRLPMPDKDDPKFRMTPSRKWARTDDQAYKAWEAETRQRWRALKLVIQAKLEAVESGITSFEEEFLAHIVLPDNTTVGDWATPQIEDAYKTGKMPRLLPALPKPKRAKKHDDEPVEGEVVE
jgi:hypothetical protein